MTASVADILAFAALPAETLALCERVYGGTPEDVEEIRAAAENFEAMGLTECDGDCDEAVKLQGALDDIGAIIAQVNR